MMKGSRGLKCPACGRRAQVEGGWVFGMGMMLQEGVDYSADGQPLYNSTWDYKIPSAACIPREFNIALLKARTALALCLCAGSFVLALHAGTFCLALPLLQH